MIRIVYFLLFISSGLMAQGNFGFQFGLNDDNFGSIRKIDNKFKKYNLDIKNPKGFHIGMYSEIDLITFYIRPELNLIFSKSKNGSAFYDYKDSEDLYKLWHKYRSTDIQLPIIFGYKILDPVSIFAGPSFKYNLSNYSSFKIEDIEENYFLSFLIGTRVKINEFSIGVRYERGLNKREVPIIQAKGVDVNNGSVNLTTNKLSINVSYDIPYGLFKKKD